MPQKLPWNKGKLVGQKAPFRPRDVHTIKQLLENAGNLRDLAQASTVATQEVRGFRWKIEQWGTAQAHR